MSREDVFHLGVKALIRNHEGAILLMQVNPAKLHGEHRDYWDLPGGRVQSGDSIIDTLKREVSEETGISDVSDIQPINMVLSNIRIPVENNASVGLILSIYSCTVTDDTSITLSEEHIASAWFSATKAAELLRVKYPESFCKVIAMLH